MNTKTRPATKIEPASDTVENFRFSPRDPVTKEFGDELEVDFNFEAKWRGDDEWVIKITGLNAIRNADRATLGDESMEPREEAL